MSIFGYLFCVREEEGEEVIHMLDPFQYVAEQDVEVSGQVVDVQTELAETYESLELLKLEPCLTPQFVKLT